MVVAALDLVTGEDLGAGEKLILVCRLRSRGFLGAILTFLALESASLWMSLTVSPWVLSCAAPSRPIAALRKRCGLSERVANPQLLVRDNQDIEKICKRGSKMARNRLPLDDGGAAERCACKDRRFRRGARARALASCVPLHSQHKH
jgi:hypothetical protein